MKQLTNKEMNTVAGGENNCECISANTLVHLPPFKADDLEECCYFCCDFYKKYWVEQFKFQDTTYNC